jgi:hypothetical protein
MAATNTSHECTSGRIEPVQMVCLIAQHKSLLCLAVDSGVVNNKTVVQNYRNETPNSDR